VSEPFFRIKVIEDLDAFLKLLAGEKRLQFDREPHFFYFHDPVWTEVVWNRWESRRGSVPFFLLAFYEDEIVGWWPLVLSKRSVGYRLQNLGQELSDYAFPFIYDRWAAWRSTITAQMLQTVLSQQKRLAFAQFAGFLYPPDPFHFYTTADLAKWLQEVYPRNWQIGPPVDNRLIDLRSSPRDAASFFKTQFSKKFQKNINMDEKKLRKFGSLEMQLLRGFAELEPLRDHYFSWYRYRSKDAAQHLRKLETWWEFYRQMPASNLHVSVLNLAGEPLSIVIGFIRAGQFDYFSPVFNPSHQGLSPGKIHLWYLLQALLAEGCPQFNFLVGGEEYKQHWSKENYHCWRVRFYHRHNFIALIYWLRERCRR
jgi:CelD/BcsL family acetyltransferase involved in cellulose biosynthesis